MKSYAIVNRYFAVSWRLTRQTSVAMIFCLILIKDHLRELQRPPFSTNVGLLDGDNLEKIRPDASCEVRGLRRPSTPQSTDDRSIRRHSGSCFEQAHTASCPLVSRESPGIRVRAVYSRIVASFQPRKLISGPGGDACHILTPALICPASRCVCMQFSFP